MKTQGTRVRRFCHLAAVGDLGRVTASPCGLSFLTCKMGRLLSFFPHKDVIKINELCLALGMEWVGPLLLVVIVSAQIRRGPPSLAPPAGTITSGQQSVRQGVSATEWPGLFHPPPPACSPPALKAGLRPHLSPSQEIIKG